MLIPRARTPALALALFITAGIAAGCAMPHNDVANGANTHAPTTTTVTLPVAPQPSAEAAAAALISSWATGNRAEALSVATPTALATLFAAPYTNGLALSRGCNTNVPVVCTFGPPGGSAPTDPIYQLYETQIAGGWYVSSVQIDG
jgi:hypothetical protein